MGEIELVCVVGIGVYLFLLFDFFGTNINPTLRLSMFSFLKVIKRYTFIAFGISLHFTPSPIDRL